MWWFGFAVSEQKEEERKKRDALATNVHRSDWILCRATSFHHRLFINQQWWSAMCTVWAQNQNDRTNHAVAATTTCEINVVNTAQYELKSLRVSLNGCCCCCCCYLIVFYLFLSLKLKLCYITPSAEESLSSSHSIISNQVCVNFTCACISVAVLCLYSLLACSLFFFMLFRWWFVMCRLLRFCSLVSQRIARMNASSHQKIKF